jgi:hypothetical protein
VEVASKAEVVTEAATAEEVTEEGTTEVLEETEESVSVLSDHCSSFRKSKENKLPFGIIQYCLLHLM